MLIFFIIMVLRVEIIVLFRVIRVILFDFMEVIIFWNSEFLLGYIDGKMSNLFLV